MENIFVESSDGFQISSAEDGSAPPRDLTTIRRAGGEGELAVSIDRETLLAVDKGVSLGVEIVMIWVIAVDERIRWLVERNWNWP